MKMSLTLIMCLLSFSLFAKTASERVDLMKYVIKQEGKLRLDTKWEEASWFQKFKLIDEAYAYKEGEACLILGFKSTFKNGMCRLSAAEGLKEYKKQCSGGELPCNPQVFGKPSADKAFCVSQSAGRELSKACAKETFDHLATTSKSEVLKDLEKKSLKEFDLDKIDLSKIDEPLNQAMQSIFKAEDSNLDAAIKFTKDLCEELKLSKKSGHQPMDVKTCESHLALLEKGNVTFNKTDKPKKEKEKKDEDAEETVTEDKAEDKKDETPQKKVVQTDTPTEEECVEPVLDKQVDENIKDVQKVTEAEEPKAWLACIDKIEAHKKVAPQLKSIADFAKERDRYFGYWHNLDGQKQFGIQCNPAGDDDTHETFTFLSPAGFTQVKAPANEHTGVVLRMTSKGKEYYIVQDMIGDYFELHEKDKLKSAPKGTQEDVRNFHKKGQGSVSPLLPVPADKTDDAKMCVRQRIDEYASWITYPTGILPGVTDYNKDVATYNTSIQSGKKPVDVLGEKYAKSVDQIKKEAFESLSTDLPECKGILTENEFNKEYDKDHAQSIILYNKMRGYLGLDKTN